MPVRPNEQAQLEAFLTIGGSEATEGLFGMDVQIDGADDGENDLDDLFDVMPEADAEDQAVDADTPRDKIDEMPESSEAHRAKIKPIPNRPSSEEVAKHDCTHCPYRSWCPICVRAGAREDPHPRSNGLDEETGLPTIALDDEMIEDEITILTVKDKESGAALALIARTRDRATIGL